MQIFKQILNHFSGGNKSMNEQVFGQRWILLYFRISRHVNFPRFKFSSTGHTFYKKNYGFTHFKPLWIPHTTLNLEDIT